MKVYGEHTLSETTCRDWFRRFKSGEFEISNKDRGKSPKKLKMQNCRHCWTKGTISRRLHAIGKIQKEGKLVPYELKQTLKGEKSLVKFCLIVSKESHFCIALLLAMKSGSISTIPSAKNHGRPRPAMNITTSTQYSWKEGFAVYLMGSEGSCVLWTDFQNSTSILTKRSKIGSTNG